SPCHQPNSAPVTIQECSYSQRWALRLVRRGCESIQAASFSARSVSGISSSGSFGARGGTNAGGRCAGAFAGRCCFLAGLLAGFFAAGFLVTGFWAGFVTGLAFGAAGS